MTTTACAQPGYVIKEPKNLSPRIQWLRDYYFQGVNRTWNNEFTSWTTGTPWDIQYEELPFYIVPETYTFFSTFRGSFKQTARPIKLHPDFWSWSLPERKAWFVKEVMVHYLPQEILPGDLLAGARFNIQTSTCLTKREAAEYSKLVYGKGGTRQAVKWFHDHGYGNAGATSGHLIPDYARVIHNGWQEIHGDLQARLQALPDRDRNGAKGHTDKNSDQQQNTNLFHFDHLLIQFQDMAQKHGFRGAPLVFSHFIHQFGSSIAISGKKVMTNRMTIIGM